MEKITKKRFREIIENNKTALIGRVGVNRMDLNQVDEFVTAERINAITDPEWRNVEIRQTNSVMFSNKSWMEFKSGASYYQRDNLLFVHLPELLTMVYLVA